MRRRLGTSRWILLAACSLIVIAAASLTVSRVKSADRLVPQLFLDPQGMGVEDGLNLFVQGASSTALLPPLVRHAAGSATGSASYLRASITDDPGRSKSGPITDNAFAVSEHQQILDLVPRSQATHVAVRDGAWEESATWNGAPPAGRSERILIPAGISVEVRDRHFEEGGSAWIHVQGTLRFDPQRDTGLAVTTLVVGPTGRLRIGSQEQRVDGERVAVIRFSDRGERDRIADPFDLTGGLLALGNVEVWGARVDSWRVAKGTVTVGQDRLHFEEAPLGWRRGDRLIIPAISTSENQDELVAITSISADGRTVTLDQALAFDHRTPPEGSLPIGNLTRNVRFESARRERMRRGHVMIAHRQTGTVIDGAGFYGLGRTDGRIAHTIPELDAQGRLRPGSDDNTIARYPLHFHIRSGARRDIPPHIVRNSVVVDSPKHGIVNHGGHLDAIGNLTYNVDGSHFFAENGSEIGQFRGNLAVRSRGSGMGSSGYGLRSRMYRYDFGHGGHGFWLQGGGVAVIGNHSFGHAGAAFSYNASLVFEGWKEVKFAAVNLLDPTIASGAASVEIRNVPFYFAHNQGAASLVGLDIWNQQRYHELATMSRLEESLFWGVKTHGVLLRYTRNIAVSRVAVLRSAEEPDFIGIGGINHASARLTFDQVRVEGFEVGIDMPTRGVNAVRRSYLSNLKDVRIRAATGRDFQIDIEDLEFGRWKQLQSRKRRWNIFLKGWNIGSDKMPRGGDISKLLNPVVIRSRGGVRIDGRQLFFLEQGRKASPFDGLGIDQLEGLTALEAWERYRVAFGGSVAPADAVRVDGIYGLVGSPVTLDTPIKLSSSRFTNRLDHYVPSVREASGRRIHGAAIDLKEGWNLVPITVDGTIRHELVYGDTDPPELVMDREYPFPTAIHPDDVRFGIRLKAYVLDQVGEIQAVQALETKHKLVAGPDNIARGEVTIQDRAGNLVTMPLEFRIDPSIPRRGRNASFFNQGWIPVEELAPRGNEGHRVALPQAHQPSTRSAS